MRTFHIGGVHPRDNKQFSALQRITECPLPKQAIIPLVQHIGAPTQPVVEAGAKVKVGELLAKAGGFVSANICSPVSGTVTKIGEWKDAWGAPGQAIYIDVEGDEWLPEIDRSDKLENQCTLEPKAIIDKIAAAGIVGLGGACFPTHVKLLRPRMASGHLQGRMLKMFVRMIRPKQVLEIGTYSGYSALCLAEGLEDGAMLHTFEINDEQEDFTRPWLENSPYADRIRFYIGDALEMVPKMDVMFDLAFMDGNKRFYVEYYEMILQKLNPGGYILADNTLWDGHVLEEPHHTDTQTIGIKHFNDLVAADTRVEKVILPMRDGLTIIRKK